MHRVFAYGTLKSGQPNHHHLKTQAHGRCEFVATACTDVEYPLVIATVWNLPLLLYAPGKGQVNTMYFTIFLESTSHMRSFTF